MAVLDKLLIDAELLVLNNTMIIWLLHIGIERPNSLLNTSPKLHGNNVDLRCSPSKIARYSCPAADLLLESAFRSLSLSGSFLIQIYSPKSATMLI